jgi:hypothetical protein
MQNISEVKFRSTSVSHFSTKRHPCNWRSRQRKRLSPLSEIVGSILPIRTHMKRASQRSAESRGFSPVAPVSSTGKVDRVGYDKHS